MYYIFPKGSIDKVNSIGRKTEPCTGEFLERKLRVFIFRLQLHVQPIYIMANAGEKTELEDPPLSLKSPAWEHCGLLVKYCNGERRGDSLTGDHYNWWGSQMCWRCGLKVPSREGSLAMSANQEKHSDHPAHRSKSWICIFILNGFEHYSTQRCWTTANHC